MKRNKSEEKEIALERIKILFEEARRSEKYADRYVELARKIAMKLKVKMPSELKRRFCRHCNSYLRPGKNSRIRASRGKLISYCFKCKKYSRFVYHKNRL